MTFTGFLITFIALMGASIAFIKILNSRTVRVFLMTRETHRQEVEMEKESQKSRQRMLEEIQNPDIIVETIIKMKRGEEVSIPLVAFDYIYRNLNKFTLIDKRGKITIVNQEDYFKFKEKALSLMKNGEEKTLNIEEVMKEIQDREAKKPIEITKHEDGTIVKTDHIARKTEIIKPNGEKVIVNHKTDTMISINLVEEKETKEDQKSLKEASREKDKKIKALEEENKLNRAKIKESKESKEVEDNLVDSFQKNEEEMEENNEEIYDNFKDSTYEKKIINDDKNKIKEKEIHTSNTLATWKQGKLSLDNEHAQEIKKEETLEEDMIIYENSTPLDKVSTLYPFEDLDSFLKETIHFKEDSIIKKLCLTSSTIVRCMSVISTLNAHQTQNSVKSNTYQTHNDFETEDNTGTTYNKVIDNVDETHYHVKRISDVDATQLCVVFDERTNCILVNVHYFFLSLLSIIEEKDHKVFTNLFYKDIQKGFVDNNTLSVIIAFINNKASLAIASKLFMQEEKENKNLVNFRPIKVIDANKIVYQGLYLFMFTNSGFVKKMIAQQEKYIFGTNNIKVTDDERTGIKITPYLLML